MSIGKKDECDSARDLLWKRAKIPDGKLISRGWRTKLREQQAYDTHQIQQLNKNATENLHKGERTNLSTQHATMKRHQDIYLCTIWGQGNVDIKQILQQQ